jgi:hypothetical protein
MDRLSAGRGDAMQTQAYPLEPFFQQTVRNIYEGKLGMIDPELTSYIAHLLCEFTEADALLKARDEMGHSIEELQEMMRASDPIYGNAASFDAERAERKYIGDYALFMAGMAPSWSGEQQQGHRPSLGELIEAGKESYFIVSQFNLFEYQEDAPLFARLAEGFERCVLGLTLVREELAANKLPALPSNL